MSKVVIIGGNECMECQYISICKEFNCKAKVFTKCLTALNDRIGNPDLIVLFTNPVSHEMAKAARKKAAENNTTLVQSHCGSAHALRSILKNQAVHP
ncbi:hypothetical protein FACS1894137_09550 [Spirochaetia bacterium]|nr:hypothetical protein FACS1894137_09550 [Spirochaetia bacterium]